MKTVAWSVAACHGPAGIVNIKLSNGRYHVDGKIVNGFTDDEETAIKLDKIDPFLLDDKLKERGGFYENPVFGGNMW